MNHSIGDGTSYWEFWNMWSEIHRAQHEELVPLSRMPNHNRWFPNEHPPPILLPFTSPDEFVSRFEAPTLRERIIYFTSESIARLKAQANEESKTTHKISSFQALPALCWRAIIWALCIPPNQVTKCRLAVNNRHRLDPPLPREYLGNCVSALETRTTVGELLEHNLGWSATLLHQSVINQNDKLLRRLVNLWMQHPFVSTLDQLSESNSVLMGSSPRFDMYGNEFGLRKAVAVRSGYANKFVGKVTSYPGYEGNGSVDLEICLSPEAMRGLESDEEFMNVVSSPIIVSQ